MRRMITTRRFGPLAFVALAALATGGWGARGHMTANRVAVDALPADGPVFLREYRDWIAATGPLPDSWRGASEPYSKIFEDPNHGWFKEQFSFMKEIPRNRYEFVLRLYDEYLRLKSSDPAKAQLMNVRWTGTLPYAAMENYDRMKSAMRAYRAAVDGSAERKYQSQDIAFYMGWLGHYTADGAQPLHDTIHHDGWQGPNPGNYTRDGRIHTRFETAFVELIDLKDADLAPEVSAPKVLADPFAAIVAHLDDAYTHVEDVYRMDARGAFATKDDPQARALVVRQLARAASLLRDLTYTAWVESGMPAAAGTADANPISLTNPAYNPEVGTAPPAGPPVHNSR
jgi:hypothetical protein